MIPRLLQNDDGHISFTVTSSQLFGPKIFRCLIREPFTGRQSLAPGKMTSLKIMKTEIIILHY